MLPSADLAFLQLRQRCSIPAYATNEEATTAVAGDPSRPPGRRHSHIWRGSRPPSTIDPCSLDIQVRRGAKT